MAKKLFINSSLYKLNGKITYYTFFKFFVPRFNHKISD